MMVLPPLNDTIAAISTAPGVGAIGIVRLSGPRSHALVEKLTGQPLAGPNLLVRRLLADPATRRHLDEAMVAVFRAPDSFSGEDMAEIHAHGNWTLLMDILDTFIALGARRAGPGEFTLRAYLNRKIDLARAEAVADLIHARSEEGRRSAVEALAGRLTRRYEEWKSRILRWKALTEVAIDFTDDVREGEAQPVMAVQVKELAAEVAALVATWERGRAVTEGIRVVLAGNPNAGKSSLFNRLLGENRAIVHEEPGTTRDRIEEWCLVGRIPARLTDTAGIREGTGGVEAEGISRSRQALESADIVLHVVDSVKGLSGEDQAIIAAVDPARRIGIWNKTDLPGTQPLPDTGPWIPVSCATGEGLENLVRAVEVRYGSGNEGPEGIVIARRRQRDALAAVAEALGEAARLMEAGDLPEVVSVEFQAALDRIGELTGETTPDDVLGAIFSEFCIGK